MNEDQYKPISCAQYDIYEIAIMHGEKLNLIWFDKQGFEQQEIITPQDLKTLNCEEYLIAADELGQALDIRLDKITRVKVIPR